MNGLKGSLSFGFACRAVATREGAAKLFGLNYVLYILKTKPCINFAVTRLFRLEPYYVTRKRASIGN